MREGKVKKQQSRGYLYKEQENSQKRRGIRGKKGGEREKGARDKTAAWKDD